MWPSDLAPDNADLGATDLLLAAVDEGDLLAKVEAASFSQQSICSLNKQSITYLAPSTLSTPSILIRLVEGWVTLRERW